MQLLVVIALLCQSAGIEPKTTLECHKYYLSCVEAVGRANPKADQAALVAACVLNKEIK